MVGEILAVKGIDYLALKTALVPSTHRREVALVFDTSKIESASYGQGIHRRVLSLLAPSSSHSVLCGDCTGSNELQDSIYESLQRTSCLPETFTTGTAPSSTWSTSTT